jgi:hypothetical protein
MQKIQGNGYTVEDCILTAEMPPCVVVKPVSRTAPAFNKGLSTTHPLRPDKIRVIKSRLAGRAKMKPATGNGQRATGNGQRTLFR